MLLSSLSSFSSSSFVKGGDRVAGRHLIMEKQRWKFFLKMLAIFSSFREFECEIRSVIEFLYNMSLA